MTPQLQWCKTPSNDPSPPEKHVVENNNSHERTPVNKYKHEPSGNGNEYPLG
jgi:hypothetical protein